MNRFETVGIGQVRVVENQYNRKIVNRSFQIGQCSVKASFQFIIRHIVTALHHSHRNPLLGCLW